MNPGHWRQPQIIRLLAAAGLAALALVPISASAQSLDSTRDKGVPCVSCLVIGITPADLASPPQLSPGSLDGLQLLVPGTRRGDEIVDFMQTLAVTGATAGVLIAPSTGSSIQQIVFEARTTITALRAEKPDLQVVLDGEAFAARRVPLAELAAYADAVIGETWSRLPPSSNPTVDDLVTASLTPGGERVLLPVDHVDWRVLQEFAARRPTLVEVTGVAPTDRRRNPRAVSGAAAAAGRDCQDDRCHGNDDAAVRGARFRGADHRHGRDDDLSRAWWHQHRGARYPRERGGDCRRRRAVAASAPAD